MQKPKVPESKYIVTYLENEQPSPAQEQLLRENDLSVFEIAANSMISAPHRTKDNWWRSVRHIDLHVCDEQKEYVGEDASNIAVFVPNDASVVDRMIAHLQADPDLIFTAEPIVNGDDSDHAPKQLSITRPFEKIGTVRDALTWSFDLISAPRSSVLRNLSAFATDDDDIQALNTPQAMDALKAER